jgi:hypothetical protein
MAEIDVSDAVGAGVRLITRKPIAVLAWGALPMAVLVAVFLLFGGSIIASIVALAQNAGAEPRPEQVFGLIGAFMGAILILILSMAVVSTLIRAAAFRSELEPDNSAWAYLRFGAQEFWVFASIFVLAVILFVVQLVIAIPIGIVTGVAMVGTVLSSGDHNPAGVAGGFAGLIILRLVIQLVLTAVTLWVWLRLCMGPVMSFKERQFRLFESWAMTKGHVWRMFLVMLLAFLIIIAIYIVLAIIGFIGVIAIIGATPGMSDPQTFFLRPPAQWISALLPMVAVVAVLGVVLVGSANALVYGAVARMYRQLNPDADPAATFA